MDMGNLDINITCLVSKIRWLPLIVPEEEQHWVKWLTIFSITQQSMFIAATILNFYFFYRVKHATSIHVNFRIILCCTSIAFQLNTGSHFILHKILEYTEHVEDRFIPNVLAYICCNIHMINVFGAATCMNMIALEQHLATIWVENYEQKTKKIGVILMLLVAAQCIPTGLFYQNTLVTRWDFHTTYNSCLLPDINPQWLMALRHINEKRMRSRLALTSLSARFQQTKNSENTASITPSMIGYAVLAVSGLFIEGARIKLNNYACVQDRILLKWVFIVMDGYALYHNFCFLYYNHSTRREVLRDLERIFGWDMRHKANVVKTNSAIGEQAAETYFNNFGW
ncbi:unnamed protein product [Bursaphelenchus xylophilus]|uniref:(pine wood nematode) hypothetical protein n=1 Tax=Bursaphelenchus xylophilus TaxID=6326 RepID=A0A7I8WI31_BURXY|nr:unnamed protein product [Bursaphelenchus xylophilus]CAG9109104.1 unnamed protein product [Bursaphelenchus xylophilus]